MIQDTGHDASQLISRPEGLAADNAFMSTDIILMYKCVHSVLEENRQVKPVQHLPNTNNLSFH